MRKFLVCISPLPRWARSRSVASGKPLSLTSAPPPPHLIYKDSNTHPPYRVDVISVTCYKCCYVSAKYYCQPLVDCISALLLHEWIYFHSQKGEKVLVLKVLSSPNPPISLVGQGIFHSHKECIMWGCQGRGTKSGMPLPTHISLLHLRFSFPVQSHDHWDRLLLNKTEGKGRRWQRFDIRM